MNWISVNDRLPESKESGLHILFRVIYPDGEIHHHGGFYDRDLFYDENGSDYETNHYDNLSEAWTGVTHWMPLPTPPEGE